MIVPVVTNITNGTPEHFRFLHLDILKLPTPERPSSLLSVLLSKSKNTSTVDTFLSGGLLFSCGKVIPLGVLKFPKKVKPDQSTTPGLKPIPPTTKSNVGPSMINAKSGGKAVTDDILSGKAPKDKAATPNPDPATMTHQMVETQPLERTQDYSGEVEGEEEDEGLSLVSWSQKHTRLLQIEPLGIGEDSELYFRARFARNLKDETKHPATGTKEQVSFCPSTIVYKVKVNTS